MSALGDNGPVVVIGAGPAGALLATLLGRHGHDVEVYESRRDMRRHDISAGRSINLALAARGIAALRHVGVMERVSEITIRMRGRMVHDEGGDVALQPYGSRPDEVIHSVSRSDLNAILLDAAEATGRVTIRFEQRCRGVDFDRSTLAMTNAEGAAYEVPFGAVFGADGAGSVVRKAMIAAGESVESVEPLGHGYKELIVPPAALGSHAIDPHALHIWPRRDFMLIALANPGGSFTATLFLANEGPESFASLETDDAVAGFFDREFPDFVALHPAVVADFFDGPTGGLATLRCQGWHHEDRAALVGDAAHAIVPFHGQGMNAAMESCLVLDRHLSAHPDDLATAFAAYAAERKPDTDAIADMALDNYVEMRSDVLDPQYLLRRALALELERRFPDRVAPRYSMVMFRTLPYGEARWRAERQTELMGELTRDVDTIDEVDMDRAARLVAELPPLPEEPA